MNARTTAPAPAQTDRPVPPLSDDIENLFDDLTAIHPGIDQILAGARTLMLDRLDRDSTQTVLVAVAGDPDGTDLIGVLIALVARLTNHDTNPCLHSLDPAVARDVRRIGDSFGTELDSTAPRDRTAAAVGRIDPYIDHDDTVATAASTWRCPDCDTWNTDDDRQCIVCDRPH